MRARKEPIDHVASMSDRLREMRVLDAAARSRIHNLGEYADSRGRHLEVKP